MTGVLIETSAVSRVKAASLANAIIEQTMDEYVDEHGSLPLVHTQHHPGIFEASFNEPGLPRIVVTYPQGVEV